MDATTPSGSGAIILMYHRVAELLPDAHGLCIAPAIFREHMVELTRRCHLMPLMELASALERGDLPPRATAITFDDGCLDNLTTASGILSEFEVPATFFIPTERLGEKHEFWWDTLERVFLSSRQLPTVLELAANGVNIFATETDAERTATHRALAEHIRGVGWKVRDALLHRIVEWAGLDVTPRDTHRPMLADELCELSKRRGHAIGAHSVHHVGLPTLSSEEKRREMLESKETLEDLLGTSVTAFAYPYGHVDAATLELARDVFTVALTTRSAPAAMTDNPRALPRFDASRLTRTELVRLLNSVGS